jgi:signal transduction histidine kinase
MRASLTTRIVLGVLLVVLAFGAALGFTLAQQRRLVGQLDRINTGFVPITRNLDAVQREIRAFTGISSESDPALLLPSLRASLSLAPLDSRVEAPFASILQACDTLARDAVDDAERSFLRSVATVIGAIRDDISDTRRQANELRVELERNPGSPSTAQRRLIEELLAIDKRVGELGRIVEHMTDGAVRRVRDDQQRAAAAAITAAAAATMIAFAVLVYAHRSLRRIRDLTRAAGRFAAGDYRADPVPAGHDEVAVLAQEFAEMAVAINDRDQKLRRQNDQLEDAYHDLVEAQRARVNAERLATIGELSSRITHELRNPLSSITLNLEMLREELDARGSNSGETAEIVDSLGREVARLTALTGDYLSLARTGERLPVDLGGLVADVARQLRNELDTAQVTLRVDVGEATVVEGDPARLRQVLLNLIGNAREALASAPVERRTIELRVERRDQHVIFEVADDGPGVDPAVADQVFEPFFTTRAEGTGLGLDISRRIVEDLGGTLTLEPPATLRGARFVTRLAYRSPNDAA